MSQRRRKGHDKDTGSAGFTREAAAAAAELESRNRELRQRIDRLESEHRGLGEVRELLVTEEESLIERLAEIRRELELVTSDIDAATQRKIELGEAIAETRREGELLRSRCVEQSERERELAGELVTAERELGELRGKITAATAELEVGRSTLARIDRRLAASKAKG